MKAKAYIGAILAAAVGAGLWAAVSFYLAREIGWIAWGIGGMVGGVAFALGGRGPISGGTAAVLTIAAMLAGKAIALEAGVEKEIGSAITVQEHAELMADAEAYPGSEDTDALRSFVVDHSFSESGSDQEIEQFLEEWEPNLERWKAEKPSFESWYDEEVARRKAVVYEELGWFEIYKKTFGPFDLIFVGLGITTAFKLAGRPEELFSGGGAAAVNGPADSS